MTDKVVSSVLKPWNLGYQRLSDVQFKETQWLWYPYVPRGTATLLFGNGGMGKSWITCAIASTISRGEKLPGQKIALPAQKVLMVSAEDDLGRVIKPRMESLGANMDNIYVSDNTFVLDEKGIRGIEQAMREVSATIVFLDPLVSYLGGKMDINKSNESRAMIGPLAQAAQRNECAVVIVHHVRKDGKGKMVHQAMGSADISNAVRSAVMVDQTKAGQHFMAHVKSNWAAPGRSLAYSLVDDTFVWDGEFNSYGSDAPLVSNRPRNKASDWLRDQLKGGPELSLIISQRATEAGINSSTLNRAKVGIAESYNQNGVWFWRLCDDKKGNPSEDKREVSQVHRGQSLDRGSEGPGASAGGVSGAGKGSEKEELTPELANLLATMKQKLADKQKVGV